MMPALAVCLGLAVLAMPLSATAQSSSDWRTLLDRVERLDSDLKVLQRNVYRGDPPPPGSVPAAQPAAESGGLPSASAARLSRRLDQFENQIRRLTGQIEEIGFDVRQAMTRLDKLVEDVDFRLTALEQSRAAAPSPSAAAPRAAPTPGGVVADQPAPGTRTLGFVAATAVEQDQGEQPAAPAAAAEGTAVAAAPSPTPAPEQTQGSPKEQYEFAKSLLWKGQIVEAEQALSAFLSAHPNDSLAGNAQYWLGETFYVRQDFDRAARAFLEGFQKYPDSQKAPDNLLKLGKSLAAMGQSEEACVTFKELDVSFPKASPTIKRLAAKEKKRLSCK